MNPKDQQDRDPDFQDKDPKPPIFKVLPFLAILMFLGVLAVVGGVGQRKEQVKYNEFLQLIDKSMVKEVSFFSYKDTLEFTKRKTPDKKYEVKVGKEEFKDLAKELRKKKVQFTYGEPNIGDQLGGLLYIILPFALILIFMMLMMRQAGGGPSGQVFNFGKSKARKLAETTKITFKDVAGVDEAKEEMTEIVDFLKDPGKFSDMGAKIPKGILLVGPPGCGKTLLAKAIAGEAGVPFFYMSGSDFVEMFVGVGASRVRDLFNQAKKNSPCLIFIDEIDAVGRQRGAGLGGGHDEREQTLNQMLVEMDGFEANSGVILLAATNRPDVLDPALLRPGRFDRQIVVDNPDANGREEILRIHSADKPIGPDVDLQKIAKSSIGFSGADLANVCNEAAIMAVRRGKKTITMDDFDEAIERSFAGPQRKSRTMRREERYMTAIHEVGHALAARFTPEAMAVHKITILPRGRALGYTMLLPSDDLLSKTRKELLADIVVSLGGLVAEDVVFGDITTGAAGSDLKKVTAVARAMVMEYGMSNELGPIAYGQKQGMVFIGRDFNEERNYSEAVAQKIDKEVFDLVERCKKACTDILIQNKTVLLAVADLLMEEETISGADLDRMILEVNGEAPPGKSTRMEVTNVLRGALRQRAETNGKHHNGGPKPPSSMSGTEGGMFGVDDMLETSDAPAPSAVEEGAGVSAAIESAEVLEPVAPIVATVVNEPVREVAVVEAQKDNLQTARFQDFAKGIREIKSRIKDKLLSQDADALRVLKHIGQVVDAGDMDAALSELQVTQEKAKGDLGIYVHMEMGEVYLKQERVPEAVKEYMRVLMLGAVKLGQQSERVIISFVRYLKILDQLMAKNGLTLQEISKHPELIREANSLYEEWEHRVGYPKS